MEKKREKLSWIKRLCLLGVVFLVFQGGFFTAPAWAHRLLIHQEEPGALRVLYEGRKPAQKAVVTLFNAREQILLEGPVDKNGRFTFDHLRLKPAQAVVTDGLGHRATFDFATGNPQAIPVAVKAVFGVALLAFIASYFNYRAKRKSKTNELT